MSYRVQSVERSIDVLEALAAGPKTVTEISRETGLAKGTAFRIMSSLAYKQFVVREPGGSRHLLGPGLLPLIANIQATFGWVEALAGQELRELWLATGETVVVHLRFGSQRVCVGELPSPEAIRYVATVGSTEPIHVGSAGKVLLACMPEDELEKLLPTLDLQPITEHSIASLDVLRKEVELARGRGWAISLGERIEGAASISVPVRIPGAWAALSVLGPAVRMTAEKREAYIDLARKTGAKVEAQLAPERADSES
ncbi:MAG: IclR family transcriptional regulator [Actinobacteria bacterium]|nr:IclR family transcriptional regulator [Actinomycetota bacterium]MBS1881891.1 IclR family transcriptional regulator [Actinomycetota bacterium]